MTDEEILLLAIREAQVILDMHIEPLSSSDPEVTLNELLSVLKRRDILAAADRTERRLRRRSHN